jgi:phage tail sheath protein FI
MMNVINDESDLVSFENINPKNDFLVDQINYVNLQRGTDGIVDLTPGDFIGYYKGFEEYKGLGIFEEFDEINIIVSPDVMVFEDIIYNDYHDARESIFKIQKAMIDQCERLGDRFAILDAPKTDGVIDMMRWSDKFDSAFAAIYYPKIEIINPEDSSGLTSLYTPPSGHVAGVYALCDEEDGIHRAPANKVVRGAVGLETPVLNEEIEFLYPRGINCMKYTPGMGIKIWGARTVSSDPEWRYINVRRVFSAIKEALKNGTGWAVFEPNDEKLRKRLVRHVTAFLIDMWRKGLLTGKTMEEAFFIRCDDELNYPEEIDAGRINIEVGIAISKPAEFLIIKLKASRDDQSIVMDE